MIPRTVKTFNYSQFGNGIDIRTSGKNGSGVTTIRDAEIKAQDIHVHTRFKPDVRSAAHKTEAQQILLATMKRLAKDTGRKVVLHFRFPGGQRKLFVDAKASPKMEMTPAHHEQTAAEINSLLKHKLGLEAGGKQYAADQSSL